MPFVLRGVVLVVMFAVAFRLMHDVGFTPEKGGRPLAEMRKIASRLDRLRLARAGGEVADGRVAVHRRRRHLRASTRCSPTCSSSTAIRRPTRSPAWWRRSWPAPQILGGVAAPRIRRLLPAPHLGADRDAA